MRLKLLRDGIIQNIEGAYEYEIPGNGCFGYLPSYTNISRIISGELKNITSAVFPPIGSRNMFPNVSCRLSIYSWNLEQSIDCPLSDGHCN